ncbi:MAG: creatininase family protein [Bacteroidota bacterium]|nr:creatininase family protein [Bacteroidota bacterium]
MVHHELAATSLTEIKTSVIDLAILPWGATEPHNLHLPYGTDCLASTSISVDAAKKAALQGVRCMVLPAIPLGSQNPGQTDMPLCIHARYETQKAILTDIVASLQRQGFRKLVIINGHGGNSFKNMIRDLAVDYPDFTVVIANWYDIIPQEGYFENHDDHAGEMETSVIMHYFPELVLSLSEAGDGTETRFSIDSLNDKTAWTPRHWTKATSDTGVGNPKLATAEKGKRYTDAVSDRLCKLFIELTTKELY